MIAPDGGLRPIVSPQQAGNTMKAAEQKQFRLTVLGSGTCVPDKLRFPASYHLKRLRSNYGWLIDLGSGALQRLAEVGESYRDLSHVFVSHRHPDHIASLLPLLQALLYSPGFQRTELLRVYGPSPVQEYLEANLNIMPELRPTFPFQFFNIEDRQSVLCEDCKVQIFALKHSGLTLGFRFTANDKTVAYGADTGPCTSLVELAQDADLAIFEASFRAEHSTSGHMTTLQAGEMAAAANVKRLLISHFYPEVVTLSIDALQNEIRQSGYLGEILIARDLMQIEI